MTRSHPPTLLTLAARTIREERLFGRGDRVLVAVSGGPDSMALLHVLALLRPKLGHSLVAHGVDHGLRAEAAAELDLAESFARVIDVPFERSSLEVAPGGNLQARAREARYEALHATAGRHRCAAIATAHHLEDRAETVLLRLLRGAGPRGLAVLPPRVRSPAPSGAAPSGAECDLVRPFIRAPRAAIDAHVARHEVPFSVDPSNRDPRFLRVRVRRELLPLLRALSPGIDQHLCALAEQLDEIHRSSPPLALDRGARGSLQAIAALLASRSSSARVWLKGGNVARWDSASRSLAVGPLRRRERGEEASGRQAIDAADEGGTPAPQVPPPPSPEDLRGPRRVGRRMGPRMGQGTPKEPGERPKQK